MSSVESPKNPRFAVALTADQIDWSLLRFRDPRAGERLEQWFPSQEDFRNEASDSLARSYGQENSRSPVVAISPDLRKFLLENRPPTLFFSPDNLRGLLTPESNIVCNYEETSTLKIWEFTLNPRIHEVSTHPNQRPALTLTRRKTGSYDFSEPYLVIASIAGYDGSSVTFDPKIKTTFGDTRPKESLDAEMIKLLGLKQHKVQQGLIFSTKEQKMQIPYEAPTTRTPDNLERAIRDKKMNLYFVGVSLQLEAPVATEGTPLEMVSNDSQEASEDEASDMESVQITVK